MHKNKILQAAHVIDLFDKMLIAVNRRRVKFLLFSSNRPRKCSGYFTRLQYFNKEDNKFNYHIVFKDVKNGNVYLKYWLLPLKYIRFTDLKNYSTFIEDNEVLKVFFENHLERKTKQKITKFHFIN